MILFIDTSALVKLYVTEAGSKKIADLTAKSKLVAASRLAYPEARSALARRSREGGLSARGYLASRHALDRDFPHFVVVELSHQLALKAGDIIDRRGLKGSDAIHVASALELQSLTGERVRFASFDSKQVEAVEAEGLEAAF